MTLPRSRSSSANISETTDDKKSMKWEDKIISDLEICHLSLESGEKETPKTPKTIKKQCLEGSVTNSNEEKPSVDSGVDSKEGSSGDEAGSDTSSIEENRPDHSMKFPSLPVIEYSLEEYQRNLFAWLKLNRMHKYYKHLHAYEFSDLFLLTRENLLSVGFTNGAITKFLGMINQVRCDENIFHTSANTLSATNYSSSNLGHGSPRGSLLHSNSRQRHNLPNTKQHVRYPVYSPNNTNYHQKQQFHQTALQIRPYQRQPDRMMCLPQTFPPQFFHQVEDNKRLPPQQGSSASTSPTNSSTSQEESYTTIYPQQPHQQHGQLCNTSGPPLPAQPPFIYPVMIQVPEQANPPCACPMCMQQMGYPAWTPNMVPPTQAMLCPPPGSYMLPPQYFYPHGAQPSPLEPRFLLPPPQPQFLGPMRSQVEPTRHIICFCCGQQGHKAVHCPVISTPTYTIEIPQKSSSS